MVSDGNYGEVSLTERAHVLGFKAGLSDLEQISAQYPKDEGMIFCTPDKKDVYMPSYVMRSLLAQARGEGVELPNINAGLQLYSAFIDRCDNPQFYDESVPTPPSWQEKVKGFLNKIAAPDPSTLANKRQDQIRYIRCKLMAGKPCCRS